MSDSFCRMKEEASQMGLTMTAAMEEQFSKYYSLLILWNQSVNLTAVTAFDDVVEKHFLDSIILCRYLKLDSGWKMADIGTGAGFPGIPLKIMFPELEVVLIDSLQKRVRFLEEAICQLHLEGITAVHGRAEDLARDGNYRGQFDLAVSRAVANLSVLSEYCLPFVKRGGVFAAYKSGEIDCEAAQAKAAWNLLGGGLHAVHKFQLPHTDYERSFVLIDKLGDTPNKYPRKAGTPAKQPLGQSDICKKKSRGKGNLEKYTGRERKEKERNYE